MLCLSVPTGKAHTIRNNLYLMKKLTLKETFSYIKEDAFRLSPRKSLKQKVKLILTCLIDSKFGVLFWFRISRYLFLKRNIIAKILFIPSLVVYRILQHWTGVQIPVRVDILGGAKLSHFSNIVIVGECVIGKNFTIMQGVTIGRGFSKKNYGCPVIGDNVIVFAGAKVFGNITIGNNVIIGANSVVFTDVPSNSVVAGNPAKIISSNVDDVIVNEWKPVFYGY